MAFIVEDGTVVADANSLASVAYADDYFLTRGNTVWGALTVDAKKSALVNGTDYTEALYRSRLAGELVEADQPLSFPRTYDSTLTPIMPTAMLKAVCEYAVRASQGPLAPDIEYDETGRVAIKTVDEVGPIREERGYAATGAGGVATPQLYKPYPVPDALMASLLKSVGYGVIRA